MNRCYKLVANYEVLFSKNNSNLRSQSNLLIDAMHVVV